MGRHFAIRAIGAIGAIVLVACIRSSSVVCEDGSVCPSGTECATFKNLTLCIDPGQRDACAGLAELAECMADFVGTCHGGVCLPIGCGNGRIDDPLYGTDEQCDDGDRASHDGCSSTCRLETPRLRELAQNQQQSFSGLGDHAMALDASRSTLTMFGGASYGGPDAPSSLTVERPRATWSVRRTITVPEARFGHAVVYDARRERVVMFGGQTTVPAVDETWEWNGDNWKRIATDPGQTPPARTGHAMAYDPMRGVTLLHGGRAGPLVMGDTWEWNGSAWTQPPLTASPPALAGHSMVFDPARGVIVLVGTNGSGQVETWEHDGDWRPIATTSAPPSGAGAALGYDGVDRTVVQVAGIGATATSGTWLFDGTDWIQRASNVPAGLSDLAVALEPIGGRMIVNGGFDGSATVTPTTWRWDGATWALVPDEEPSDSPACGSPLIALDSHRRRVVAFCHVSSVGETWELDDAGWHRGPTGPAGPPARNGGVMAYDSVRREIVLFGGQSVSGPQDLQTWTWDGTTWTAHGPGVQPQPLRDSSFAFDGEHVVLFGGQLADGTPVNETWQWNGATWQQRNPTGMVPSPRSGAAMAYDPIRDRVLMFGGVFSFPSGETWEWDRTEWRLLSPTTSPQTRQGHALAWDAARRRLVLVGGNLFFNTPTLDVWEWDGSDWIETPGFVSSLRTIATESLDGAGILVNGSSGDILLLSVLQWRADTDYEACGPGDRDRDGLRGCADPDCWARCTPTCRPGMSCAPDQPRCGDGSCDARLEDCHLCPGDCGSCPVVCGDFICAPGEDCVGDCGPTS